MAWHPGLLGGVLFRRWRGEPAHACIVRWPQTIPAGRESNEIMHVCDWFTTLLKAAGVDPPADRLIDGVDQLEWLTGRDQHSAREGYISWMGPDIYSVKWHDFKLVLVAQKYSSDAPDRLASPHVINPITDPRNASRSPQPARRWTTCPKACSSSTPRVPHRGQGRR